MSAEVRGARTGMTVTELLNRMSLRNLGNSDLDIADLLRAAYPETYVDPQPQIGQFVAGERHGAWDVWLQATGDLLLDTGASPQEVARYSRRDLPVRLAGPFDTYAEALAAKP